MGLPGQWAAFLLWWFREPDSFLSFVALLSPLTLLPSTPIRWAERAWRGHPCSREAMAQKWHTSLLLTFFTELDHVATLTARKCSEGGGLVKTRKYVSGEEPAGSAAVLSYFQLYLPAVLWELLEESAEMAITWECSSLWRLRRLRWSF